MTSPRNSIQAELCFQRGTYVPIKRPLYDQSFRAYVTNSDNLHLVSGEEPGNPKHHHHFPEWELEFNRKGDTVTPQHPSPALPGTSLRVSFVCDWHGLRAAFPTEWSSHVSSFMLE